MQSSLMRDLNWKKSLRCHVNVSRTSVGKTLTQLSDYFRERALANLLKSLSHAEEEHSADDPELFL